MSNGDHVYLGIDIGGTTIKAGLVKRDGSVLNRQSFKTPQKPGNQDFLAALVKAINYFKESGYRAIGIGSVGPLDIESGIIFETANIPGLKNCPILETARQAAENGAPVYINNDASVTALSQHFFGKGRGHQNLVTITLGTGIGGGMLFNGKLYNGYKGNAFEIGHIVMADQWFKSELPVRQCGCKSWGCFETFASATAITENYNHYCPDAGRLSAKDVADLARNKDENAQRVFEIAGRSIGYVCVNLTHLLNFDLVIITGGLAAAHDLLEPHVKSVLNERLFEIFKGRLKVVFTEGDENYGIMGAAALAF